MKQLTLQFLFITCLGSLLSAQEVSKYSFSLGAGFTNTVGTTGANLDNTGWNLRGSAGYNFSSRFGANLDLGYDSFGVNATTLNSLGTSGGGVHVFTALVNPVMHLTPKAHFDFYVTGGGGLFHQSQDFTVPTAPTASVYNPFFGFYPGATGSLLSLGSSSINKPGYDFGAGVAFGSKWHGKFFAEARYYHMFNSNTHTDFIPVTFGFRW